VKKFKEPLRSLIAKTWKERHAQIQEDDLAAVLDFNRGTLQIKTRKAVLDDMPPEIRKSVDRDENLKKLLTPAGEVEPKVPNADAMWIIVIEIPLGLVCERVVRDP
jgi:hypothetical protein